MFLLWALLALQATTGTALERALERLSEEAELFLSNVKTAIGTETLEQRALAPPPRFRPRFGAAAEKPPEEKWQTRRIVSEYAYAAFASGPDAVHEFRTVRTVDGREVRRVEKARALLAQGVTSPDDRLRHQMLRDFEKHGLVGAVTDFGQTILLFRRTQLTNYRFTPAGRERVGADEAMKVVFTQRGGGQAITIFEGSRAVRRPLEGIVWLRAGDLLPLRVTLVAERDEEGRRLRDEGTVEYRQGATGALLPASVVHRQWLNGKMVVENRYTYTGFRRFAAESEIKFEEEKPQ
ncbi:MAG TPA: hypothetical protein DEH78_30735 [Solibacterales bacterium]|nr:hypothetical protein [Bryobacterales bacterium]